MLEASTNNARMVRRRLVLRTKICCETGELPGDIDRCIGQTKLGGRFSTNI